ncbi:hypothetical protein [Kitasatospora sp. NPDC059160]|uniref:hypothetical protein n=1 Tax=Kitasatospora sp. NPDC059160 TaxID=3346748 RepID=UPI0036915FDE
MAQFPDHGLVTALPVAAAEGRGDGVPQPDAAQETTGEPAHLGLFAIPFTVVGTEVALYRRELRTVPQHRLPLVDRVAPKACGQLAPSVGRRADEGEVCGRGVEQAKVQAPFVDVADP